MKITGDKCYVLKRRYKRQIRIVGYLLLLCLAYVAGQAPPGGKGDPGTSREATSTGNQTGNCSLPAILEFPPDLFSQKERQSGAVLIHFLVSAYIFYCLALICDDYFVPSIERICDVLQLSSDVAGATFMAVATSSPELFTNIIGTFVTDGDIGLGTILGSAMFNILAVSACCGFAAQKALRLDWYSLTRDCIIYTIAVVLLIVMLANRRIFWFEALILVLAYVTYILVMWKNSALKLFAENNAKRFKACVGCFCAKKGDPGERSPLLAPDLIVESDKYSVKQVSETEYEQLAEIDLPTNDDLDEEGVYRVFSIPQEAGFLSTLDWVVGWPARFLFTVTIPDCRRSQLRQYYQITFVMCIIHIGLLTYVVSWMMTVIGHTLSIPDSVMGLTFLAAGNSVPEAISSIIVARQGLGSMSVSNSIGSNTFDILMCLGLPWLIRTCLIATETKDFIEIHSGGLEYTAMLLILIVLAFYTILALNGFYLDRKVAFICAVLHIVFLAVASVLELNVFWVLSLPTCNIKD